MRRSGAAVSNSIIFLENEKKIVKKYNLYYNRFLPFRLLRLSGAHFNGFAPGPKLQRLQRWRVVGNVWEI